MKIHYFYRREYDKGFYNLEIIAWLEEKETSREGYKRLSFTQLERLKIFLSKDNGYHNHSIEHDFGEKSCYGHYAHTRKELIEAMRKQSLLPIDGCNYERFRRVALNLYSKQPLVDFSKFKGTQKYTIRQIIGE
ncbi:hypothetical protein F3D69_21020 [Bacteroides ovatus]|jgi:hypothetical protein|uniref:Uncharacterized protein n=1 Tax=Bacteroides ovatus TaxID=28116 RepID=A0A5M5ELD2_BACOV|nr:hypothetical protein F3F37_21395 [Bacteroides ovatus]KAA4005373.1 hypothetical protein F3D64_20430 [Bacteroides ovatus]KAA4016767.1 hypothetical protein F3D53_19670 [Bacteroides ovatus]KAA4028517.1 hypothetical protein F3D52_15090 [Bacteroides ovatus]KAA4030362.1 hypothetical protein F3D60_13840 [Bacteroides ovatus]